MEHTCINFTINNYAYQKTTNFKKVQKKWEKLELQKRKSNLFNEKLELIKISKYTQKIYTHTAALCIDSKEGKQWPKTTQHGLSVKGKKTQAHAHTPTHSHTQKQNPSISQQYTQSTTNTNSELFYNASFLNTKDAHLGCIYIFFQWFTVDLF